MWTRSQRAIVTMALLLIGSTVRADATETLVGAVTASSQDSVRFKTNQGADREVALDGKTQYVRWVTHQPWQQSTVADHGFVKVGRCISVEMRGPEDHVAKLVRINTDEVGSIYCPCRSAH